MKATIYGLSSEGYSLASILALKGVEVSIVDELQRMALKLSSEIARTYPDVNSLIADEPLLGLEPEDKAIKGSDYLFFAPKIRRVGQDSKNEIISKLRDAVNYASDKTSIIFNIPSGFGDNLYNLEVIEHVTGIDTSSMRYYYLPLGPWDYPSTIGSLNIENDELLELLNLNDLYFTDLESAEMIHASKVLANYASLISMFGIYKKASRVIDREEFKDIYLDDLCSGLFDLRIISLSIEQSNPLSYIVNGSIKSIESYIKHLASKLKRSLNNLGLRANKVRISIAWSIDNNEIRGDKLYIFNMLTNRLNEYYNEVSKGYVASIDDKTPIVIVCSKHDYEKTLANKSINDNMIIVKANPFCELIKD